VRSAARRRSRGAILAAGIAAGLSLLAGCGGGGPARQLDGWECVQSARDQAQLAQSLADPAALGSASTIRPSLRALTVPGLRAVSFLDPDLDRPLPFAALDASRRDTFTAWLELAAPRDVRLARNAIDVSGYEQAIVDACTRAPLPQRPVWDPSRERWSAIGLPAQFQGRRDPLSALAAEAAADALARGEDDRRDEALRAAVSLLGESHARDLLVSAASAPADAAYDGDADGLAGSVSADGVRLSARQIADVLLAVSEDSRAFDALLYGLAREQAELIRNGSAGKAESAARYGDQVGAFAGILETVAVAANSEHIAGKELAFADAVVQHLAGQRYQALRRIRSARPVPIERLQEELPGAVRTMLVAGYVDTGGLGSVDQIVQSVAVATGASGRLFPRAFIDRKGRVQPWGSVGAGLPAAQAGLSKGFFKRWLDAVGLPTEAEGAEDALAWRFAGCCPRTYLR
jgi:hypothetical protein